MNELPRITDVSNETFQALVIERSHTVPVLVDYWADWCGPCQMQMPVLKKLVDDYDGKFVLAKVNSVMMPAARPCSQYSICWMIQTNAWPGGAAGCLTPCTNSRCGTGPA